jgi:hypothetical protein
MFCQYDLYPLKYTIQTTCFSGTIVVDPYILALQYKKQMKSGTIVAEPYILALQYKKTNEMSYILKLSCMQVSGL